MKKANTSDIKTIVKINNVIPKGKTLKSLKIIIMLLHCFRIFSNFMKSPARLKKALKKTASEIEKKYAKHFKENAFSLSYFAELLENAGFNTKEKRGEFYIAERQAIVKADKAYFQPKYNTISALQDTRNIDHKAIDSKSHKHLQQISANANSINKLENGEISAGNCNNTSYFYNVSNDTIAEFYNNLVKYLEGKMSEKNFTKYCNSVIK